MEIYKLHELYVLLFCAGGGVVIGVVFDVFRAIRKSCSFGNAAVAVHDSIFWTLTGVIAYMCVYISNNAELRWFEPVGFIIGFVLYMLLLSHGALKILCPAVKLISKIASRLANAIALPFSMLGKWASPVYDAAFEAKSRILYKLHNCFSKTGAKIKSSIINICKKF